MTSDNALSTFEDAAALGMLFDQLEEDDEPFEERMQRLTNTLARQFKEGAKLEKAIMKNLSSLGFSLKEPV